MICIMGGLIGLLLGGGAWIVSQVADMLIRVTLGITGHFYSLFRSWHFFGFYPAGKAAS
jgi:putative ABC transport system permease protein